MKGSKLWTRKHLRFNLSAGAFLLVISKKLVTVFLLAQAIHIKESVAGKLHSLLAGICDTRSKRG